MKASRRTRRALRMLALAGCATALVLPSAAGARPIDYHAVSPQTAAAIAQQNASTSGSYQLPAAFSTDTQTNGAVSATPQTSTVVVREVHTTTSGSNRTLALVLASAALGIALCAGAYAVVRTSRIQRRVLGSNS